MSVRYLGLILDNTLGMEKQVNSICKSCYYQIRNKGLISKYVNDETWKTLVQALIISRLDNGNALLYNFRSLTSILFHTFKILSGTTPLHVSDLTQKYIRVRMLRSESYSLLRIPRSNTVMYGERSFQASAPRMWNELPNPIKLAASKDIFYKTLKTHLFKLTYL